jgi:hypothetical protein
MPEDIVLERHDRIQDSLCEECVVLTASPQEGKGIKTK